MKYCVKHASHWLSSENVTLSVRAQVPPYSVEAFKTGFMPQHVDIEARLASRNSNIKHFFPVTTKAL